MKSPAARDKCLRNCGRIGTGYLRPRKQTTADRSSSIGRPLNVIAVPGYAAVGAFRKMSSAFASHTVVAELNGFENSKPATLPTGRPNTVLRLGPKVCPCFLSTVWQIAHLVSKMRRPCSRTCRLQSACASVHEIGRAHV